MKEEELENKEVTEWKNEYDFPVNVDDYLQMTEDIAKETCYTLLSSICSKIGLLEGIKKANEIIKYKFDLPTEIDSKFALEEIEKITKLEIQSLIVGNSMFSPKNKEIILDKLLKRIEEVIPETKKKPDLIDVYREQLNRVYNEQGELPSPDINSVKRVKENMPAARPFGRKKK